MKIHALFLAATLLLASSTAATASGSEPPPIKADPHLTSFFKALGDAESKLPHRIARIAWWGDSAIVSDGYTGRVRQRLQERFGDAGPGFSLADTTFPGYLRAGVRIKRNHWEASNIIQGDLKSGRYGYGGIQVRAWGGASTTFESRDGTWDRVEVLYRAFPKAGELQLFADGRTHASATMSARAEQAEDDVWRWDFPKGTDRVRLRAGGKGLSVVYGVALERGDNGVILDSLGLLGMRARRWLNVDPMHMVGQLIARRPDLLVINFGGNERVDPGLTVATHKAEIEEVTRLFKGGAPRASCLIVGPIAHGDHGKWRLDPALKKIYEAQRAAADELGCAFFDTVAAMGGDEAVRAYRKGKLIGGDLSHLNKRGHAAVGDLIADWILGQYDAWKAAR